MHAALCRCEQCDLDAAVIRMQSKAAQLRALLKVDGNRAGEMLQFKARESCMDKEHENP